VAVKAGDRIIVAVLGEQGRVIAVHRLVLPDVRWVPLRARLVMTVLFRELGQIVVLKVLLVQAH